MPETHRQRRTLAPKKAAQKPRRSLRHLPDATAFTERQQAAFVRRSGQVYQAMVVRLKKIDLAIPFDGKQFRVWLLPRLNKQSCPYCQRTLTMLNFGIDHVQPLSRGGAPGLDNLQVVCRPCNTTKGELTHAEFYSLLQTLNQFDEAVKNGVLGRLKAGAATWKRFGFMRKGKAVA